MGPNGVGASLEPRPLTTIPFMNMTTERSVTSKMTAVGRMLLLLVLVVFAAFNLMLAIGAASLIDDCVSVACGQAAQSLLAFLAVAAIGVACYRLIRRRPISKLLLLGTLPLFILHAVITIVDPTESIFFVITSGLLPVASMIILLTNRLRTT